MSYLEKIKSDMNNSERSRELEGNVIVDGRSLMKLVDEYERMEAIARLDHNKENCDRIRFTLHEAIEAVYKNQHKNSDLTLQIIMECLLPLIKDKHNSKVIESRWRA